VAEKVTPIVAKEFQAADRANVPCFIFLKRGAKRDPATERFVADARAHANTTANFQTLKQLKDGVAAALLRFAVRAGRGRHLEARSRSSSRFSIREGEDDRSIVVPAPSRRYADITVSRRHDGQSSVSLDEIVQRVHRLLAANHYRGALDLVLTSAEQVWELGFADTVLELMSSIRDVVPREVFERADEAWLINAEGLALGQVGKRTEAIARFDRMREIGEAVGNRQLVSTALQNYAAQIHLQGNLEEARRLYAASLKEKMAIDDLRGAVQVMLNLAGVYRDLCKAEEAADLLADVETLFVQVRTHTYY
jgi:tetratricopeptide (TPR) repeat protein